MSLYTTLVERIVSRNGRLCPECGRPVDHFGPEVTLPGGGQPALVCRTADYAYVHILDSEAAEVTDE